MYIYERKRGIFMNRKLLFKFIPTVLLFAMVFNTTFSYAALKASQNKEGRKVLNSMTLITNSTILKYSTQNSNIFNHFKSNKNLKISNPDAALEEVFTKASKFPIIKNYFEAADISPERLATIVRNVAKDIDWTNPETFNTLLKQLITAIINTTDLTNGIVTKEDVNKMIEDMTSGKYYYPDATDEVTYTNIQDIARLSNYGLKLTESEGKPISIGKVYLHGKNFDKEYGTQGKEVYMVALNGTGFVEGQQYGIIADLLSGMEADSEYLQYSLNAILENIPKGSNLFIAGMSLGGMIAQQVMVQDCILENYNVEYVTIIGSPALCVEERVDQFKKYNQNPVINRIIDHHDLIPYASIDYLTGADYFNNNTSIPKKATVKENLFVDNANYHYKTGIAHHFIGYLADEVWKNYDPLGFKGTSHTITLKHSDFTYYDSPSFTNGKISIFE